MQHFAQRGFTLIEVVVAFAIFALAMGTLYECFAGAGRRVVHARARDQDLLLAQSLLSRWRISAQPPLNPHETGSLEDGGSWRIDVRPSELSAKATGAWRAYEVTVHVIGGETGARELVLRSVELAKVPQPSGAAP